MQMEVAATAVLMVRPQLGTQTEVAAIPVRMDRQVLILPMVHTLTPMQRATRAAGMPKVTVPGLVLMVLPPP